MTVEDDLCKLRNLLRCPVQISTEYRIIHFKSGLFIRRMKSIFNERIHWFVDEVNAWTGLTVIYYVSHLLFIVTVHGSLGGHVLEKRTPCLNKVVAPPPRKGGGCTQQSFIWGVSTPRSKPLPFYIPFLIEKVHLSYTFHTKLYPFHIPTKRLLLNFSPEKPVKILG